MNQLKANESTFTTEDDHFERFVCVDSIVIISLFIFHCIWMHKARPPEPNANDERETRTPYGWSIGFG